MPKLSKKPVTAADMARLRAKSQTPERRKEIASKAGSTWWASLTDEARAARLAKMAETRRLNKARRNQTSASK